MLKQILIFDLNHPYQTAKKDATKDTEWPWAMRDCQSPRRLCPEIAQRTISGKTCQDECIVAPRERIPAPMLIPQLLAIKTWGSKAVKVHSSELNSYMKGKSLIKYTLHSHYLEHSKVPPSLLKDLHEL